MTQFDQYTSEIVTKALTQWEFKSLDYHEQQAFLSVLKDKMLKDNIFFMKIRKLYSKEFVDCPVPKSQDNEATEKLFTDRDR